MNQFKFAVGAGLFREYSQLFSSLDAALLALDHFAALCLVPSGHAAWKPFLGRPANETSPLRAELTGRPWEVVRVFTYGDGGISETYLAEFKTALDAFAFAELKTKLAKERCDAGDAFFVCLRGWTQDGRQPEIARMPHDRLAKLRAQKRRDDDRRARSTRKSDMARRDDVAEMEVDQ